MKKRWMAVLAAVCLAAGLSACAVQDARQPEEETVKVVFWHYYNDIQKAPLDELIREYNATRGREKNIEVEAFSQGSVNDLIAKIDLALNKSTNELNTMNMFLGYRDIVSQILRQKDGELMDYREYMTQEELAQYNPSYLKEGEFGDGLYILPLAKSTELLLMDQTKLDEFLAANSGYGTDSLATWEGIADMARAYYEWTDAMTPDIPYDGKAFIGMDTKANYFIIQNHALGSEIYSYNEDGSVRFTLDADSIKKLWRAYYEPFTKGYYGEYGKYRNDDMKQSLLAGFVGSSSSISFFPDTAVEEDGRERPVKLGVYRYPCFEGGEKAAVQQGAGMAVVNGSDAENAACLDFIKWLTLDKGFEFSSSLGYMPAGTQDYSEQLAQTQDEKIKAGLKEGLEQSRDYELYYGFDFENAFDVRVALEDYFNKSLAEGREEFQGYLAQGMDFEQASEAMDYEQKAESFYEGIEKIFNEN